MIILKFGGTSVSTKERLQTITEIVKEEKAKKPLVVVSAIRGVTDLLLLLCEQKIKRRDILSKIRKMHVDLIESYFTSSEEVELKERIDSHLSQVEQLLLDNSLKGPKLHDAVISMGEVMSATIVSKALTQAGFLSRDVHAKDLIVTDTHFGSAEFIPFDTCQNVQAILLPLVEKNIIPVVTGFIGATKNAEVTTLGRGGSDYSAAIIGYALNASEIQIWTDVEGIFSADPRVVSQAVSLKYVSYKEASELAAFGAKVLHPKTISPAITANIPVYVRSTLNPLGRGTEISETAATQRPRIAAIAEKERVKLVNLYSTEMLHSKGFLRRIFTVFASHDISIDLVSVSEVSVSVTLDNDENLDAVLSELQMFTSVSVKEVGVVSLIGEKIMHVPSIMRHIFSLLERDQIDVHMMSLGASEINISLVIDSNNVQKTVKSLHDTLIEEQHASERSFV